MQAQDRGEISRRATRLERSGEWDAAAALYSDLFRNAVQERDIECIVEATRKEARIRRHQGRYNLAEELATLSFEIAERNGLTQAAARAANVLASLLFGRDMEAAKGLFEWALESARHTSDDELIGLTTMNLGVIASHHGDLHEAQQLYLESIAASVRSGDKANAAMAYNNLGIVCTWLYEWMEAELYFGRGIEIAERLKDINLLARLWMNRAEPLIHMGDLLQATRALDQAEKLAIKSGSAEVLATTIRFRGAITRIEGDLQAADNHLLRALGIAEEWGLKHVRSEVLEATARLRWEQHRLEEAKAVLQEAHRGFLSLGARREVARVEQMLAKWTTASADTASSDAGAVGTSGAA